MSFYSYRQNNSGGGFDIDPNGGLSIEVIIEADSADEADLRAGRLGIYFDGCRTGRDCSCCGDRWDPAYGEGDKVPSQYGQPLMKDFAGRMEDGWKPYKWTEDDTPEIIVHHKDGRVVGYWPYQEIKP